MEQALMVKQFLGVIHGTTTSFNVYNSGKPGWVVLRPVTPEGHEGTLEFCKPRRAFKRGVLPRSK